MQSQGELCEAYTFMKREVGGGRRTDLSLMGNKVGKTRAMKTVGMLRNSETWERKKCMKRKEGDGFGRSPIEGINGKTKSAISTEIEKEGTNNSAQKEIQSERLIRGDKLRGEIKGNCRK